MNSELHQKISWQFCGLCSKQNQQPIIYLHQIYIYFNGNDDASGIYTRTDIPFQTGYFTPIQPNSKYIFVKNHNGIIYRLFMGKHPNYQWYLESFYIEPIAVNFCRLSLEISQENNNQSNNLCQYVVPNKNWISTKYKNDSDDKNIINNLRIISLEFKYERDRIFSIYLIYQKNIISLISEIIIKGNDMYFYIFTKKDEKDLEKYYNQIVVDLKTFNVESNMIDLCQDSEKELPTLQLLNYHGKIEALGGKINGEFIITFYSTDDCINLYNTIKINAERYNLV